MQSRVCSVEAGGVVAADTAAGRLAAAAGRLVAAAAVVASA